MIKVTDIMGNVLTGDAARRRLEGAWYAGFAVYYSPNGAWSPEALERLRAGDPVEKARREGREAAAGSRENRQFNPYKKA